MKNFQPSNKEKDNVKKISNQFFKSYNFNILRLKKNDVIWLETIGCNYKLIVIDPEKSRFIMKGRDAFFKNGEEIVIAGTIMDNVLKTFCICENGRLEILYNDKIIRTNMIKKIIKDKY